jgi:hypothetical protein
LVVPRLREPLLQLQRMLLCGARPPHTPLAQDAADTLIIIDTIGGVFSIHLSVVDEQHLRSVLAECVAYYNRERPHRTLRLQTPENRSRPANGPIRSRPVLNGLHHVYERAA